MLSALQDAALGAEAKSFTFHGRAWGHGLGMPQWGAKGLAEKGWSASRILTHFYSGTKLASATAPKELRVGLLQEQSDIALTGSGRFDFYDNKGTRRVSGAKGETWKVRPASGKLTVLRPSGATAFTSAVPVTVRYEPFGTLLTFPKTGNSYKRGRIDFDINASTGRQRAILIVAFEPYLYGLGEMPSSWHTEALKAQAIAARTYALEKVQRLGQNRSVCNCGLYASTVDQAYVGARQEVTSWVGAVDATKGQVVTYSGKLIQAFYSSSSGGFTENNEYVWGGTALPYLRGKCDPGDYASGANPHSNWSVVLDGDQIGQRFAKGGYNVGSVTKIEFLSPRGVSGRVRPVIDSTHGGVRVTGSKSAVRVSGGTFRSLLGLKSTLIFHNISGNIRLRYDALNCSPGLPTGGAFTWRNLDGTTRGPAQNFKNGRLFWNQARSRVYWTKGPILARYDDLRRRDVDLGLPISDEYAVTGGRRSDFEHGSITYNSQTGATTFELKP